MNQCQPEHLNGESNDVLGVAARLFHIKKVKGRYLKQWRIYHAVLSSNGDMDNAMVEKIRAMNLKGYCLQKWKMRACGLSKNNNHVCDNKVIEPS